MSKARGNEYKAGHVQWHSSEEDGGPDVGILIGLGNGTALWCGELTSEEGDSHTGLVIYGPNKRECVARLGDYDEVRDILEHYVAPALRAMEKEPKT